MKLKRLMMTLAAALVAMVVAAPVAAQTTVTSSGREGPTTCVGRAEVNAANLPITALSTSSVTVTAPQVTWSQVLAPLGDGQAPTNALVTVRVYSAATGLGADNDPANGLVGTIASASPTYAGGGVTRSGLSQNTLYYVTIEAIPAGRPAQIIARHCFMTGGTYTINNQSFSIASDGSNGCFSISPRTPQDVRNCLCGRGATGSVTFNGQTQAYDYSSIRGSWGCR